MLIISGIAGNIIVCGSLYRPLFKGRISKSQCPKEVESQPYDKYSPVLTEETIALSQLLETQDTNSNETDVIISLSGNLNENTSSHKQYHPSSSSSSHSTPSFSSFSSIGHHIRSLCCDSKFIDKKVLLNWKYVLFALSNVTLYFWYDVPYVFTVDRAVEFGESDYSASLLVSVIGILHTVGNILCGYIGDRPCINRSCFYSVALWICGGALALVPLFRKLVPTGVLVGTYGLLSAATEALKIAVLTDIVGTDSLTNAYGTLMFLQGIANLVGPPFAGCV